MQVIYEHTDTGIHASAHTHTHTHTRTQTLSMFLHGNLLFPDTSQTVHFLA